MDAPPKITKDTQPTISVTLWRCSSCGKWSHAKRRPKTHEVWSSNFPLIGAFVSIGAVKDEDVEYEEPRPGAFVPCGPFEKWEAWKVETND